MHLSLPPKVNEILDKLEAAGFEAYAVGGCVRDSLLGYAPSDWDVTTSARPLEVKEIFPRTVDTGILHGTISVLIGQESFEVTTYRIDGAYEDFRHPKEVSFTRSLEEDLKRRDFTVNAMAFNEREGLVDLFDGAKDLEKGIVRCVGEARERFHEDALRMLRAVRISAQLGFSIEERTRVAIVEMARNLDKISKERIQAELVRLLTSPHPENVRELYELGISAVLFPWLDVMMLMEQKTPYHCYTVGEHTIQALAKVPPNKILRLTMLFHDVAKPACLSIDEDGIYHFKGHPAKGAQMASSIMRDLKFDHDTIGRVKRLILWHDDKPPLNQASVRKALHRIGEEQFPDLFTVKRADAMAKSDYGRQEELAYVDAYEGIYREIIKRRDCLSRKDLAVSGFDLIAAGMKPGKAMGEALEYLLEEVLERPEDNAKEILMEKLQVILNGS